MTNVGWTEHRPQGVDLVSTGRQIETEVAPIRYVAELVGAETDSEKATRWLIALTCDPLDAVDDVADQAGIALRGGAVGVGDVVGRERRGR
jgi:hypothetical protein